MGLFDKIVGDLAGGGNAQSQVMGALQSAGISGLPDLVQRFEQSGLGQHMASWIGNGENLPINAGEIEKALGTPAVAAIAAKFGIDPKEAAQLLSQHLPGVVDKMTPGGSVPSGAAPGGDAQPGGTGSTSI